VTEIGTSSYELAMGLPGSPDEQAASLSARLEALASADGVLIWTLHDFPEIDASAVGASPWVERLQSAFGLIAADGSEKPAATAVRSAFAKRAEP
jgi:endo-1,4-beta-mannosidase